MKNLRRKKPGSNGLLKGIACAALSMLFVTLSLSAQNAEGGVISGKVVDEAGNPIVGAAVIIKNTTVGSATGFDGTYSIRVNNSNDVLEFSLLGYTKVTQTVGSRKVINVTMEEDAQKLEEVVVVGYGTMKKKDLTGSIGIINAEALEREQPTSVQDLLRTNVAGLSMGVAKDSKGNVSDLVIRGKNNFRTGDAANAPLLVLDGVIYYGELTDINPNDIERIDVLKDGSSTAIFGAKAANGVIIISTKKGKLGKPVIRFSSTVGLSMKNSLPDVYKGEEYVRFRQAAMESIQPNANPSYYKDPRTIFSNTELEEWIGSSTGDPVEIWMQRLGFGAREVNNYVNGKAPIDWEDLTYRKVAVRQDYSVSVSGKKDETSYYTSLNYVKNENNLKGGGFSSIRARLNLESKINKYLTYGVNAQFVARDEGYVAVKGQGFRETSPYGDVYNDDGTLRQYPNDNPVYLNPLIDARYTKLKNDVNVLTASLFLKLDLPFGFSLQTTYAPRFNWKTYMRYKSEKHPGWGRDKEGVPSTSSGIVREHDKQQAWQWDNMLKWNKEFGKHAFDFTFAMTYEKQQGWNTYAIGRGLEPDETLGYHGLIYSTVQQFPPNNDLSLQRNRDSYETGAAFLGRLHYTYDNKYMLTTAFRADGSSVYGNQNPYGYFPSVALGWVFTEEGFFPKNEWFNYGKLRLSYGQNGNSDVGNPFLSLMELQPSKYIYIDSTTGNEVPENTFFSLRMANKGLKWESTKSYNVGLDFTVLKSRLTGTIDVYYKKTSGLVISRELPWITGFTDVATNVGMVRNQGVELTLNSRNFKNKNFTWDTSFSLTYNKNKIKDLYGLVDNEGNKVMGDVKNGRFIGQSMHEVWDYKVLGVWQEHEAEEAARFGLRPGDFKLDKNDWTDTKFSNDDKKFLGSKVPITRLSMRNTFTFFQDFSFSFNLYANLNYYQPFNRAKNDASGNTTGNQIKTRYWTPNSPSNSYARLGSKSATAFNVWRRADILRLDNISLGYQVPAKFLQRLGIQSVNLNVTVKNLAYWSKWPGEDPENKIEDYNNASANTPTFVYFGANITF